MKTLVQGHLNVGLISGVLFVLLTYLVVSQQTAISRPNVVTTVAQWLSNNKQQNEGPGETVDATEEQQIADKQLIPGSSESEKANNEVVCSTEDRLSDYCEVDGDVRINGKAWSVDIVPSVWSSERREWKIRPYSRRSASNVDKLNVTQLQDPAAAPPCTVTHHVPGVVFALGGYSGNAFHDHADVLLPLFLASLRYGRDVQFLVINRVQPWWLGKYRLALRRLSRYDVVNLDGDAHVRCFPHLTVGLRLHKDFGVVPEWVPGAGRRRVSMPDFTRFLREAYALPRGAPASPAANRRPRLMLIQRQRTRRFLNGEEMVRAAEAAGFEVVVTDLVMDAAVDEQARVVNSFDVMVGIHGAGMTNEVFLPPGGVLIQVVPWGKLDLMARIEYGEPAADMGLKYLCYNVTLEESSLLELLGRDHPAIKDPDSVHRSGWAAMYDIYMTKQDVHLDITRFARTLAEAMDHLRGLQ